MRTKTLIILFVLALIIITPASLVTGFYFGRGMQAAPIPSQPQGLNIMAASLYARYMTAASMAAGIRPNVEATGAIAGARAVALSPDEFGIYATPDPALIPDILLLGGVSDWYIAVGSDQMVIAYSPRAPMAGELAALNREINASVNAGDANLSAYLNELYSIVLSPSSRLVITNPNTDPEGLDALLAMQLAAIEVNRTPNYYMDQFNALNASGSVTETIAGSTLIAYLQSGQVEYDLAMFKSAAEAYNLSYVSLPPQVNLGSAAYASFYRRASYTITMNGGSIAMWGSPIFFSMTIPRGYPDQALAARLIVFMLSQPGRTQMAEYGLVPLPAPTIYGNASDVPEPLSYLINSTTVELAQ